MIRRSKSLIPLSTITLVLAICICGSPGLIVKTSAQRQEGPAVSVPRAQNFRNDSSVINEESVVLTIASEDEFYIGNERIKKEAIRERIRDLLRDRRANEQKVFIKSAASMNYSTVREALNMIRDIGYDAVVFVVTDIDNPAKAVVFDARIYPVPFGAMTDP